MMQGELFFGCQNVIRIRIHFNIVQFNFQINYSSIDDFFLSSLSELIEKFNGRLTLREWIHQQMVRHSKVYTNGRIHTVLEHLCIATSIGHRFGLHGLK